MDVSVIIVTYNTCEMTINCINSVIQKTENLDYEIILVDNASQDESYSTFSQDARIRYIYSEKNLGFGKANNLGAKFAKGRYLFLLNSDTLLKNNALYEFVKFMDSSSKNIGCCGTLLTDAEGHRIHSYGDTHTVLNSIDEWCVFPILSHLGLRKYLRKYFHESIPDRDSFEVGFITGADLFIRRDAYEICGLFDPDFFMYYEDSELCARYRKLGFNSVIIKTPSIVHLEGASNKKRSLVRRDMVMKSMFIYFYKDMNPFLFQLFKISFKIIYLIMFSFSMPLIKGSFKDKKTHLINVVKL